MENPWIKLNTKTVYETPWIKIEQDKVINPSGREDFYGKVHFQQTAVGALPIDEDGKIWLVGQFRYTVDRYSWEIPLGGAEENEDLLEATKRELQEETGFSANDWKGFLHLHPSISSTDQQAYVFIARAYGPELPTPMKPKYFVRKKSPSKKLYK
ncbi:NUDIX domain-containing protein [Persicobacter sp. CCB-QB2]|uniref:NUDIX domain-containing protein n=1 Tax=Persicobacter sp. CCB-QB2 TaxID=1561025 RepID=UPI0020A18EFB|nr:NUDIX hydrolase [Persicobacter sp. CCB-QB2]